MQPHIYKQNCGAFLVPMDVRDEARRRAHPRASLDHNGRLISDYGPGRAVRRRQSHRVATDIHQDGFCRGLEAIAALIGEHAMNSLAGASKRGERGMVALLHACKGAAIGRQDYERAQQFLDMARSEST